MDVSSSDEQTEKTPIVELFFIEFGDHGEYVQQELQPDGPGGEFNQCDDYTLACCSECPVEEPAVTKEVANHNNANLGDGYWRWKTSVPKRKGILPGSGRCKDKMNEAALVFRDEASNLLERLDELAATPTESTSANESKRAKQLTDVRRLVKKYQLNNETFRKANLMLHGAKLLAKIFKGLETLGQDIAEPLPTFCQLITKRRKNDDGVDSIFDAAVAKASDASTNAKWMSILTFTTRRAKRKENRNHSETGQSKKEKDKRMQEKISTLYDMIVDRLIPYKGGEAFLVYAAIKSNCYFAWDLTKEIWDTEIPHLADYIVSRLRSYDLSVIDDRARVECPITLVSWGMKKTHEEGCQLLELPNTGLVELRRHEALDDLERSWTAKVEDPVWGAESEEEKSRHACLLEKDAARAREVSLAYLRENYPPGFEKHPQNNAVEDDSACTPDSRLSPTQLDGDQPIHILANAAVTAEPIPSYNFTQDSGYVTEVASSLEALGDTWRGTQPHNVASSAFAGDSPAIGHPLPSQEAAISHNWNVRPRLTATEEPQEVGQRDADTGHDSRPHRTRLPSHAPQARNDQSRGPVLTDSQIMGIQFDSNEIDQGISEHTQLPTGVSQRPERHELGDIGEEHRRSKRQRTIPPHSTTEFANAYTHPLRTPSISVQNEEYSQQQLPSVNSETFWCPTNWDIEGSVQLDASSMDRPYYAGRDAEPGTTQHGEVFVDWSQLSIDIETCLFEDADFGVANM